MKRSRIALLTIFLFTGITAFSQINLGLKLGVSYNVNNYQSDSLDFSFDNAVTFQGGGLVRLKIKKIHVQAEGLFTSRKGEVFNTSGGSGSKINFYTFDLPLIVGYKLVDLKVVKLRLNLGLIPSFNIAKLGDLDKADYTDSFYSAMGGISLDVPFVLLDIRYQGAIGDYYQLQSVNKNTTFTNSLLTLSIAWKII
ncbi:MAG: hypothetical protein ACI9GM_000463 [Salibacteraceae bacterium]|jgi:hypothetical protein